MDWPTYVPGLRDLSKINITLRNKKLNLSKFYTRNQINRFENHTRGSRAFQYSPYMVLS